MPGFLALVPAWAWRWLAIVGVAIALYGAGYVRGFLHEEHKFAAYQATVDELGKEAAKRAAERKAQQDKTTKEIKDAAASDVADINAYYDAHPKLVRVPARCGGVPAPTDSPGRADAAPGQPGAPGPDQGIEERSCALDAARINLWRAFATKNGFPVE